MHISQSATLPTVHPPVFGLIILSSYISNKAITTVCLEEHFGMILGAEYNPYMHCM
jgi:hypothetical protein